MGLLDMLFGTKKTPSTAAPTPAPVVFNDPVTISIADPNYDPATQRRQEIVSETVDGVDAAKQVAVWLTKGVNRDQPAAIVLLKDCTTDHLKNIILTKPNLSADYKRVIESLLTDRGETMPVPPVAAAPTTPAPTSASPLKPGDPVSDLNQIV